MVIVDGMYTYTIIHYYMEPHSLHSLMMVNCIPRLGVPTLHLLAPILLIVELVPHFVNGNTHASILHFSYIPLCAIIQLDVL